LPLLARRLNLLRQYHHLPRMRRSPLLGGAQVPTTGAKTPPGVLHARPRLLRPSTARRQRPATTPHLPRLLQGGVPRRIHGQAWSKPGRCHGQLPPRPALRRHTWAAGHPACALTPALQGCSHHGLLRRRTMLLRHPCMVRPRRHSTPIRMVPHRPPSTPTREVASLHTSCQPCPSCHHRRPHHLSFLLQHQPGIKPPFYRP
jgi:hypothetical protein